MDIFGRAMRIGMNLAQLDEFSDFFSNEGGFMCHSTGAGPYIELIRNEEVERLRNLVEHEKLALIYDGTTRLGEVLAMCMRWCDENFKLHTLLTDVTTAEKHVNHGQLSAHTMRVVAQKYQLSYDQVLALVHDSAATNVAAARLLTQQLPNAEMVLCMCHTLHNAGSHAQFEVDRSFPGNQFMVGAVGWSCGSCFVWMAACIARAGRGQWVPLVTAHLM